MSSICSQIVKHHEQGRFNSDNLITVQISSHSTDKHEKTMSISLVNCQSVCNKYDDIADYVKDFDLDPLVIAETWLTGKDSGHRIIGDLTPAGCTFRHAPRSRRIGGGAGKLYR